jgi:TolB-like protein
MIIWAAEIKELEVLNSSFKDQFPNIRKEIEQLIRTDDANVVLLYARRCLEVIVTELCEIELNRPRKTEPLKGIIDKLKHDEKVPAHIITSMLNLNSLSTFGTHPKEFEPRQVKPVLIDLATIIEWYLKYKKIVLISPVEKGEEDKEKKKRETPDDTKVPVYKQVTESASIRSSRSKIWKIISYISILVIVVLIVIYAIGDRKKAKDLSGLEKSIAVLPFENWSKTEEFAYLGDAIANEISTHLANVAGFHVLSFSSTSRFKVSDRPSVQQIGRQLHANFVIEGSVERQNNDVSINVQVIQAANDYHIWAEEFKGQWKDIFEFRAGITKKIAAELQTILSPDEIKKIENKPTQDLEAYDYYLLGRHSWNQRSVEEILKAKSFFEKAIEADPEFALAYAGLAQLYCILPVYVSWRPVDAYPRAMTLALKALELDSTLAEAYTAIGGVRHSYYWEFSAAIKDFQHAIRLNPNHSTAYQWYSDVLFYAGHFQEAVDIDKIALQVDPLSPAINSLYGLRLYYINQKDSAISFLQHMITTNPEIGISHWSLGIIYCQESEYEKSVRELEMSVKYSGGTFYYMSMLGVAYGKAGRLDKIQELLDTMEASTTEEFTSYFPKAVLLSELGKKEEALVCLQKAYEERMELLRTLKYVDHFSFSNLQSDPRFIDITNKVWENK